MPQEPRVFVSATSGDLASARREVRDALLKLKFVPVEETDFEPGYRTVDESLRTKIGTCQAMIHIVGFRYGGEPDPDSLPQGESRRSWTQREYDIVRQSNPWWKWRRQRVYVFLCREEFDFDFDACEAESPDRTARQSAYREELTRMRFDSRMWNEVSSRQELRERVREIRLEKYTPTSLLAGVAALVLLLAGGVFWLSQIDRGLEDLGDTVAETGQQAKIAAQQASAAADGATDAAEGATAAAEGATDAAESASKAAEAATMSAEMIEGIYSDPVQLKARLEKHIHEKFNAERQTAKEAGAKWEKTRKLERRRDLALNKVDDLIRTIQQGLQGEPDEVFHQASRILAEEDVNAAIGYLASHEEDILARVDGRNARKSALIEELEEDNRRDLKPLLLKADLHETNAEFDQALQLYQTVADRAPQWSRARRALGNLLGALAVDQVQFRLAESHLQAAVDLTENDEQLAYATNDLGWFYLNQARYDEAEPLLDEFLQFMERLHGHEHSETATALSNVASLLLATNRLAEAEPLIRRSLAIDEQAYGAEHLNVARDLNNLSGLLHTTNRLAEAEPLYRRALAIGEKSYGAEHPYFAICLNNLASLLQATNRLAEAEPLKRRVLAIGEKSYGAEHPKVARYLNKLALLLQDTNRLAEAEPLMRRSLAITENPTSNPLTNYAGAVGNLALLLQATNRLAEAEPLIRRALAIDEKSYGAEHPSVAIALNNLATLLYDTNRLAEAESLSRRHVEIFALFGRATGHEHPRLFAAQRNYAGILQALETHQDEIAKRLQTIAAVEGPFPSILPEVERLLGPATPVDDVLTALDERYRAEGRPEVYFLKPDQPLARIIHEFGI
jgi:tetratricopeptide (TPR) repeat protein